MPKKTRLGLNSGINLQNSLNIEDQDQSIRPFEQPAPAILNNGIWHDGGITELYEQSSTKTGYDVVYAASNGKLLKLKWVAATSVSEIYVEENGVTTYIGEGQSVFFNKRLLQAQYIDLALASDGTHALGLRVDRAGMYVDEILLTTLAVISTVTITAAATSPYVVGGAICRANVLTIANVKGTTGVCAVLSSAGGVIRYYLNAAVYDIYATLISTIKSQCGYMSAFFNAGTVIVSCPAAIPLIRKNMSPYGAGNWTTIVEPAGVNGIILAAKNQLRSAVDTLELVASTSSVAFPGFLIQVNNAGATATGAGSVDGIYPPAGGGGLAAFSMLSGVATPYGASGTCVTTAAGKYGQFIGTQYRKNNPEATIPVQNPELYAQICQLQTVANYPVQVALCGFMNRPAFIAGYSNGDRMQIINDFGGGTFETDILSGHTYNSLQTGGLLWPFENRYEAGIIPTFIYKRNDGLFVIVQFTDQSAIRFTEIAPGVVSMNTVSAKNSIVDLNENKAYENLSGYSNSYFGNYTDIATSKCYTKKSNRYSSSFDAGLLRIDPLATSMQDLGGSSSLLGMAIWSGVAGAYVSSVWFYTSGTYTGIAYQDPEKIGSTYVFTGVVPPAGDSVFEGGGIKMLSSSAIQYPGYFGYLLVNQFIKKYLAFFILQGNYYAYDGDGIYLIQLSAGNFGTVVGGPQIMASATGLTYLCTGPEMAYFLNNYDNGVWTYNGGRTLEKLGHFDQFGAIIDGTFNVHDNVLLLKTEGWLVSLREGVVTANVNPHVIPYNIYSTFAGAYFVKTNVVKLWSHLPLTVPTTSAILPLDYQSAYFGLGGMQRCKMIRVVGTIWCESNKTSPFTITWNWLTQDQQGTQTQSFNTLLRNTDGYMHFEMQPYPDGVLGGSIGIKKDVHWHFTGDTSIGTKIITNISPVTTGLDILVGGAITETGGLFAAGTVVSSIDSATQITVSNNASASAVGDTFTAAATSQRIVLMDLSVYYTEESEANLVTKSV